MRRFASRVGCALLLVLAMGGLAATPAGAKSVRAAGPTAVSLVRAVKRADYKDRRDELARLFVELAPFARDKAIAARVQYWRGFALWRRAINGFNDSVGAAEQEADLSNAGTAFEAALSADSTLVDAHIGMIGCTGLIMYLRSGDTAVTRGELASLLPHLIRARRMDPQNPRLAWVLGPNLWNRPVESGGGQERAMASYVTALEHLRAHPGPTSDPLAVTWGEPELLMNLAWSNLNRTTPDLAAADRYAREALALVPTWHYVRDILMPQIEAAKGK